MCYWCTIHRSVSEMFAARNVIKASEYNLEMPHASIEDQPTAPCGIYIRTHTNKDTRINARIQLKNQLSLSQ